MAPKLLLVSDTRGLTLVTLFSKCQSHVMVMSKCFKHHLFSNVIMPKEHRILFVVSLLTLNAVLLGRLAMPILARNVNKAYLSFSLEDKTILCVLGAVSICSWMCGLILGIFAALKMASFAFLFPLHTPNGRFSSTLGCRTTVTQTSF